MVGIMIDWLSSKVATSVVVLVISGSFLGLFGMQADYYRSLELEDLADAVSDLVTEVDLLTCEAAVEVNWTVTAESHGLPRTFHGKAYLIQFTTERPYLVWEGTRVAGRFFPSPVSLSNDTGGHVEMLEIPSTIGFKVCSRPAWEEWGLNHHITIEALLRPQP